MKMWLNYRWEFHLQKKINTFKEKYNNIHMWRVVEFWNVFLYVENRVSMLNWLFAIWRKHF